AATTAVVRALEREVEMRPCPGCGHYQPEMIGERRARRHWLLLWPTLVIFAVLFLLGAVGVLYDHLVLWIAFYLALCIAFGHLLLAMLDPNGKLEANREVALDYVEAGATEVTSLSKEAPEPIDARGGGLWGIFASFAIALLTIPAAEFLRIASGWP